MQSPPPPLHFNPSASTRDPGALIDRLGFFVCPLFSPPLPPSFSQQALPTSHANVWLLWVPLCNGVWQPPPAPYVRQLPTQAVNSEECSDISHTQTDPTQAYFWIGFSGRPRPQEKDPERYRNAFFGASLHAEMKKNSL